MHWKRSSSILLKRLTFFVAGNNSGRKNAHGKHHQSHAVPKEEFKFEDDAELVKTSQNWNGLRGLQNLGNTCFFNSIVQNLVQTVPLRTHLVPRDPLNPTEVANRGKPAEDTVSAALRTTLVQMWLSDGRTYNPRPLLNAISDKVARFRGGRQQDSHELLRFLLDQIDTEILNFLRKFKKQFIGKPMPPPAIDSAGAKGKMDTSEGGAEPPTTLSSQAPTYYTLEFFIERTRGNLTANTYYNQTKLEKIDKSSLITYVEGIFGGRIESTLMCHSCGTTSSTFETFFDLSVPIPPRFLDERTKRAIGLIADNKSKRKESKQEAKGAYAALEPTESEPEEEETVEIENRPVEEYQTLSSIGSGSGPSSKKNKRDKNSKDPQPPPIMVNKTLTNAQKRLEEHRQALAAKAATSASTPTTTPGTSPAKSGGKKKQLSARDKKRQQRIQAAKDHSLPTDVEDAESGEVDTTNPMSTAEAVELALTNEHEGIEPNVGSVTLPEEAATADDQPPAAKDERPSEEEIKPLSQENTEREAGEAAEANLAEIRKSAGEPSLSEAEAALGAAAPVTHQVGTPTDSGVLELTPVEGEARVEAVLDEPRKANEAALAESAEEPKSAASSAEDDASNASPVDASSNEHGSTQQPLAHDQATSQATTSAEDTESGQAPKIATSAPSSLGQPTPSPQVALNHALKHDIRTIPRPTPLNLDACLYEFTEPEILSGANAYGCYECTKRLWTKQSRDLTPLILQYGSPEEQRSAQLAQGGGGGGELPESTDTEETATPLSLSETNSEIDTATLTTDTDRSESSIASVTNNTEAESANPPDRLDIASQEESSRTETSATESSDALAPTDSATEPKSANNDEKSAEAAEKQPVPPQKPVGANKAEDDKKPKKGAISLVRSTATKQILIDEVPQILTLHLKRFWVTMSGSAKIDHRVEFPTILDIAPYLSRSARERYSKSTHDSEAPMRPLNLDSVLYQLYGIVVHSGTMSSGHYVAYTRRRDTPFSDKTSLSEIKQNWYYFSDTSMSAASLDTVLSQQAYILFYERVSD